MEGDDMVLFATGGYDHTIRIWQILTGACLRTLQHSDSQVNALCITPDRCSLAAAGYQHIRLYELISTSNPNPSTSYDTLTRNVTAVGFQTDGRFMYSTGEDGRVRIWDIRSRAPNCQRFLEIGTPVNCAQLHPNQIEVYAGDQDGWLHVWDLRVNADIIYRPDPRASIQSISIDAAQASQVAVLTNKGNLHLWHRTRSGREAPELHKGKVVNAHKVYGLKVSYSPDSTLLATCSADNTAVLWNTTSWVEQCSVKTANQRWVWDAAWSDDSRYLVTASSDCVARLWDSESGQLRREFSGHQKALTCLAFSDVGGQT